MAEETLFEPNVSAIGRFTAPFPSPSELADPREARGEQRRRLCAQFRPGFAPGVQTSSTWVIPAESC